MTVLFIDDDQDDIDLFFEALRHVDKSIIALAAHNGIEAFKILNADLFSPPDHIFLDINMPLMNGLEFLKRLRAEKRFSGIPVTMYTTSTSNKDIQQCQELGADYMVKPSTYSNLLNSLKERFGVR